MARMPEGWIITVEADRKEVRITGSRELVTCKHCKYSDAYPEDADSEMPLKCLGIRYGGVEPDWYCEHGKVR